MQKQGQNRPELSRKFAGLYLPPPAEMGVGSLSADVAYDASFLLSILDALEDGVTVYEVEDLSGSSTDAPRRRIVFENAAARGFREMGARAPCLTTLEKDLVSSPRDEGGLSAAAEPSPPRSLVVTSNPSTSSLVSQVLNCIPEITFLADPETAGLFFVNDWWEKVTGTPVKETGLGFSWARVLHPDDAGPSAEAWREAAKEQKLYEKEFRLLKKNETGKEVAMHMRGKAGHLRNAAGKVILVAGVTSDVSEIKKSQQELLQERSFLLTALDQVPVSVVVIRKIGDRFPIVLANRETLSVWRHPEIKYATDIEQYKEWVGYHPDGTRLEGHEWPAARSVLKGEVIRSERVIFGRGDGTRGIVELTSAPVRDPQTQEIIGGVLSCLDVTEKLQAERDKALRAAAEQAADQMGKMVANVSHEIRTPIAGVVGLAALLGDTNLDQEQRELVEGIKESGQLLLIVVSDLLDHSKIKAGKLAIEKLPFCLFSVIRHVLSLTFEVTKTKQLRLVTRLDPSLPRAIIHSELRLKQILLNLLSNSTKFTPPGGVVTLEAYAELCDDPSAAATASAEATTGSDEAGREGEGMAAGGEDEIQILFHETVAKRKRSVSADSNVSSAPSSASTDAAFDSFVTPTATAEPSRAASPAVEEQPSTRNEEKKNDHRLPVLSFVKKPAEQATVAISPEALASTPLATTAPSTLAALPLAASANSANLPLGSWPSASPIEGSPSLECLAKERSDSSQANASPPPPGAFVRLHFAITDSGIGLTPSQIDRLFKPFSQADSSTTREYGGTGLGLALCHDLLRLMGGKIGVHSEGEGKGSCFFFDFVAQVADPADVTCAFKDKHGHLGSTFPHLHLGESKSKQSPAVFAAAPEHGLPLTPSGQPKQPPSAAGGSSMRPRLQLLGSHGALSPSSSLSAGTVGASSGSSSGPVRPDLAATLGKVRPSSPCTLGLSIGLAQAFNGGASGSSSGASAFSGASSIDEGPGSRGSSAGMMTPPPQPPLSSARGLGPSVKGKGSVGGTLSTDTSSPFARGPRAGFTYSHEEYASSSSSSSRSTSPLSPAARPAFAGAGESKVGAPPALPSATNKALEHDARILVVDDNAINRSVAKRFLAKLGYHQVSLANDGLEAVEAVKGCDRSHPFDLLLMDIMMPHLGGKEATKIIKSLKSPNNASSVPIVAVSAAAGTEKEKFEASDVFDCFLTKPFTLQELKDTLESCLAKNKEKKG